VPRRDGLGRARRAGSQSLPARRNAASCLAPGAIETGFGGGTVRDSLELNHFVASVMEMDRTAPPCDIGPVIACHRTVPAAG
jgi:hypothetical protein